MNKGTKISLLVGGIVVILIGVIGITFAFFSTGGIQDTANTFQSGCLNISLTSNSSSISLNNILPITDVEGLSGTSYDFTIENTCNTATNYQVNLESLNEQANSLSANYIKVALSSDTNDNVISILSDNTSVTPEVEGAYEAYNLYTGTLNADETKTYHLRLWLDYDATVEQAANKVYSSKINVVANPETQVVDTLEAKFGVDNTTVTSTLTNNVTSATYCVTADNICTPNTNATIQNNSYTIELEESEEEQVVCTRLNGTSKIICSEPLIAKQLITIEEIIASKNLATRNDFSVTVTEDTTGTIYYEDTSKGRTYYFAGNPSDNWVQFAGFYWRIIRINEDGSLRLIYQGTSNTATGSGTQLANISAFNSSSNNNAYVGLKYTTNNVHGTGTNSTILTALNTWYTNNLASYADDLDGNAGFCGDRTPSTNESVSNGQGGTGTTTTYYGGYIRLVTNRQPTFECANDSDLYTVSGSSNGNKALQYPIGLISADEVAYAGGVYGANNQSYYLYTGQNYWTMSPSNFSGSSGSAWVFHVYSNGLLYPNVFSQIGVRPVVNLKASTTFSSGNGTSLNPYVVET